MKKILSILFVLLVFCGSIHAQYESHWSDFAGSVLYGDNNPTVVFVQIDGSFITAEDNWAALEIAAFVNESCRGHQFMVDETSFGDPYPHGNIPVFFNNSGEEVTFRLYDHSNGIEYTDCSCNISIHTGETHVELYLNPDDAVILSFTSPAQNVFTKEIIGYGEGNGRYYLIATPIDNMNPSDVDGMITESAEDYDLYWFNQSEELEWRNYKQGEGFNLVSGMGYLYANKNDTTLIFRGNPYDGDGTVSLVYHADAQLPGWNLVGNPFTDTAYINRDFYIMNPEGDRIIAATEDGIPAMEGVFVIAETDGEEMSFTTTPHTSQKGGGLVLNLSQNRSTIDRAIVRFNEGRALPKFQFNPNSTKVYIPIDHQDYAVVHSKSVGEMPVSFKASENGTYTFSVETRDVQLRYLHLIDNMTGIDVDLLSQRSYTFEANTSDYTSRFKLVFMTQCDNNNDNFAFFSNGKIIVLNEGKATVKLIDMAGRTHSTQHLQGSSNDLEFHAAPGVYILQLIKDGTTKSQKIVLE